MGMTIRQLGELRRSDPEAYEFHEEAFRERMRRLNERTRTVRRR